MFVAHLGLVELPVGVHRTAADRHQPRGQVATTDGHGRGAIRAAASILHGPHETLAPKSPYSCCHTGGDTLQHGKTWQISFSKYWGFFYV